MLPLVEDLPRLDLDLATLPGAAGVTGLYVHVPFCAHKCHYCDFYSLVEDDAARMRAYVDAVLAEATLWKTRWQGASDFAPRTIFFGGGTPTLLPRAELLRLIDGLRAAFALNVGAASAAVRTSTATQTAAEAAPTSALEFTVECNPTTAETSLFADLRRAGVTRVSLGAQSFRPRDLAALDRRHDPADVPRAVRAAREAGIERVNLDLIFAVPGQALADWDATLHAALDLAPDHVSAYALTYEEGTPLDVKRRLGRVTPTDEATELAMLHHARATLRAAGYEPYELSNFAKPNEACRHNLNYWQGGGYVGLGPSAASHIGGVRFKNLPHLARWHEGVARGAPAVAEVERLAPEHRADERVYLGLRLAEGVAFDDDLRTRHATELNALTRAGLLADDGDRVVLTERGIEVADGIAARFLP